jgi:hypothetical protein
LKNAAKFLKNLKKISPLSIDEGFELKYEELIKINSIEELRKNINKSNLIYKIEINGEKTKETMKDFSIFAGKDFSELKVLCLNEIKLKNISNLSSCSCPKLKRVDFECNLIGDDSINAFKNIKPQYINLFDNIITSIKILEVIKNNENLKEFYIGKNPLIAKDDEIMNCNNINKYHLSQKIEKLGLTNLFDQKTVEFILNQGIENIKVLYIGSYGFSSFKIFENIVFNKLEALWARGNEDKGYIEDIKEINYGGKSEIKLSKGKNKLSKDIENGKIEPKERIKSESKIFNPMKKFQLEKLYDISFHYYLHNECLFKFKLDSINKKDNIAQFSCDDPNCMATAEYHLINKIFTIKCSHSIPSHDHSYIKNLGDKELAVLDFMKKNNITDLQLKKR